MTDEELAELALRELLAGLRGVVLVSL